MEKALRAKQFSFWSWPSVLVMNFRTPLAFEVLCNIVIAQRLISASRMGQNNRLENTTDLHIPNPTRFNLITKANLYSAYSPREVHLYSSREIATSVPTSQKQAAFVSMSVGLVLFCCCWGCWRDMEQRKMPKSGDRSYLYSCARSAPEGLITEARPCSGRKQRF